MTGPHSHSSIDLWDPNINLKCKTSAENSEIPKNINQKAKFPSPTQAQQTENTVQ